METTVLVVGAGPSGLTMAIELARSGIPFRLIDRASHGAMWSQALVVQARTLEQFERYGIAAEAVRRGHRVQGAKAFSEGRMIAQVALAHRIPGRYPFVLFFPQRDTEGLLTERLTSLGGVVERGLELVDYADREGGIDAQIRPEAGEMETCRARWIVGCDGIHSTVRAIAGVPFEGNDADEFFALADVQLSGKDSPGDELHVYLHAGEVVFLARLSAQLYRVMVARRIRPPSDAPPGREELQDAIDRIARADVRVADPAWASRFHIAQRKAVHYR